MLERGTYSLTEEGKKWFEATYRKGFTSPASLFSIEDKAEWTGTFWRNATVYAAHIEIPNEYLIRVDLPTFLFVGLDTSNEFLSVPLGNVDPSRYKYIKNYDHSVLFNMVDGKINDVYVDDQKARDNDLHNLLSYALFMYNSTIVEVSGDNESIVATKVYLPAFYNWLNLVKKGRSTYKVMGTDIWFINGNITRNP